MMLIHLLQLIRFVFSNLKLLFLLHTLKFFVPRCLRLHHEVQLIFIHHIYQNVVVRILIIGVLPQEKSEGELVRIL